MSLKLLDHPVPVRSKALGLRLQPPRKLRGSLGGCGAAEPPRSRSARGFGLPGTGLGPWHRGTYRAGGYFPGRILHPRGPPRARRRGAADRRVCAPGRMLRGRASAARRSRAPGSVCLRRRTAGRVSIAPAGRPARSPAEPARRAAHGQAQPLPPALRSAALYPRQRPRAEPAAGRAGTAPGRPRRRGDARPRQPDRPSGQGPGLSPPARIPLPASGAGPGSPRPPAAPPRPAARRDLRRRLAGPGPVRPSTGCPAPASFPRLRLPPSRRGARSPARAPLPAALRDRDHARLFFQTIILLSQRNFITYVQRFVWVFFFFPFLPQIQSNKLTFSI